MNLESTLRSEIQKAVSTLFDQAVDQLQLQPTNQEFEGSHTLVCFPLTKISKKNPEETAKTIGEYLVTNSTLVSKYNVVKGFLNLLINDKTWVEVFSGIYSSKAYGDRTQGAPVSTTNILRLPFAGWVFIRRSTAPADFVQPCGLLRF
jgi:arginyl-tRNA synthetase